MLMILSVFYLFFGGLVHSLEPIKFNGIEVRTVEIGKTELVVTEKFQMGETEVTQVIWQEVAEATARKFSDRYRIAMTDEKADPANRVLSAFPSVFPGDNRPVEQVSFEDVTIWLEGLNELADANYPPLTKLFPGHLPGMMFRLPTSAEWEYVLRNQGTWKSDFPDGIDAANLKEYVHLQDPKNKVRGTEDVKVKKPLIIANQKFYGLLGNVWEWVSDTGPENSRVIRGGSWVNDQLKVFHLNYTSHSKVKNRDNFLGFRLIRVLKSENKKSSLQLPKPDFTATPASDFQVTPVKEPKILNPKSIHKKK